jgi:hypothetical protein
MPLRTLISLRPLYMYIYFYSIQISSPSPISSLPEYWWPSQVSVLPWALVSSQDLPLHVILTDLSFVRLRMSFTDLSPWLNTCVFHRLLTVLEYWCASQISPHAWVLTSFQIFPLPKYWRCLSKISPLPEYWCPSQISVLPENYLPRLPCPSNDVLHRSLTMNEYLRPSQIPPIAWVLVSFTDLSPAWVLMSFRFFPVLEYRRLFQISLHAGVLRSPQIFPCLNTGVLRRFPPFLSTGVLTVPDKRCRILLKVVLVRPG